MNMIISLRENLTRGIEYLIFIYIKYIHFMNKYIYLSNYPPETDILTKTYMTLCIRHGSKHLRSIVCVGGSLAGHHPRDQSGKKKEAFNGKWERRDERWQKAGTKGFSEWHLCHVPLGRPHGTAAAHVTFARSSIIGLAGGGACGGRGGANHLSGVPLRTVGEDGDFLEGYAFCHCEGCV